jgi:hypothetical protein
MRHFNKTSFVVHPIMPKEELAPHLFAVLAVEKKELNGMVREKGVISITFPSALSTQFYFDGDIFAVGDIVAVTLSAGQLFAYRACEAVDKDDLEYAEIRDRLDNLSEHLKDETLYHLCVHQLRELKLNIETIVSDFYADKRALEDTFSLLAELRKSVLVISSPSFALEFFISKQKSALLTPVYARLHNTMIERLSNKGVTVSRYTATYPENERPHPRDNSKVHIDIANDPRPCMEVSRRNGEQGELSSGAVNCQHCAMRLAHLYKKHC